MSWICVAMRLPDDGTGALPLLRHVILRAVPLRFSAEARASLPGLGGADGASPAEDVFAAMGLQRLRLHLD